MPKVSIIMSVYNAEKHLYKSIQSILDQTFKDFEFIITNDGSTDSSKEIIDSFSDKRIVVINQENSGLTKALNKMINISRGEYIARMDSDDIAFSNRIEEQVKFLDENKNIGMCGTFARFINDEGKEIGQFKRPIKYKDILKTMFFHNPFIHPSVCIRKNILLKEGMYDGSFRYAQDYELWTRIVPFYRCENIPKELLFYRITEGSITSTKKKTLKYKIWGLKIRLFFLIRFIKSIFVKPFWNKR